MTSFVIEGGYPIQGTVRPIGNKNAALPLLAACLLTTDECVLENAPRIRDVDAMCALLQGLVTEARLGINTYRLGVLGGTTGWPRCL